MRPFFTLIVVLAIASPLAADYAVEDRGSWPSTWPRELDRFRAESRTLEGPMQPLLHYAIPFAERTKFEAAWPHILKVKSKGAPIVLRRAPSFWLDDKLPGVCIHTPPANTKAIEVLGGNVVPRHKTRYIELIVDGKIIDLNRIQLPPDTRIIDERFVKTKATRRP